MHGRGEVTENIRDHRFGLKTQGIVQESCTFAPAKKGADLHEEIDYGIPRKIVDVIVKAKVIEMLHKKDADNILQRIEILCEEWWRDP